MGGDGGTIPGRDVLVKLKRRAAVDSDPFASAAERLLYCSLTSEPLRPPFVACMLGNLYNKEALLEHLISKVDKPAFRHIRGLKDLITCDAMFDKGDGSSPPRFKCPVTGLVANGRSSFVVMRPCGCVVSLKSVTGHAAPASFERAVCPSCSKPLLSASDLAPGEPSYIPLAPSLDAADTLRKNLALARAREAHAKAEKKARKRAASSAEGRGTAATVAATVAASGPSQAADADSDAAPSKDQPSESGAGAKRARAAPDTVDAENETSGSGKPDANEAGAAGAPGP